MTGTRTPSRKTASASKAGAARRETKKNKGNTIEWRGVELTLPDELPATFFFDLADLDGSGDNPMPVFRLLRSLVGPEQFVAVRNAVGPDDAAGDIVNELLTAIFEQYGMTLGEA